MDILLPLKRKWESLDQGNSKFVLVLFIVGVLGCAFQAVRYLKMVRSKKSRIASSRKARHSKAMAQEYVKRDSGNDSSLGNQSGPTMQITQLWAYPIKSIRGCQISAATLTKEGFTHDRKFMLLKVKEETPLKLENMHISGFAAMCLFHTSIEGDTLTVKYIPAGSKVSSHELQVPLNPPNFEKLKRVDVDMHHSPTRSYDMGEKYNSWFSELFGFKVVLAFWGGNPRPVLGNVPGWPANESPKPKTIVNKILGYVPVIGERFSGDDGVIAFNDCAPYLVITERSSINVTTRLPDDVEMDITKFRANIIVRGSPEAFDEDFWGELRFNGDSRIILTGNCGRCVSLNVDYQTGKSGTGRDGEVLKLLSKDRRVDPGMKYSPIFGRYGFASKTSEGKVLRVGDEVAVSQRNEERTRFYWPGLST